MTAMIQALLAEVRKSLEALYGERLVEIRLFGSYARDEAEAGSDLDLLVVLRGPVNPGEEIARSGPMAAELSLRYHLVISLVFMDETRFRTRQGPFLRNIRREGLPV
jgi:predicted nucleotidyltransferase